MGEVELAHQFSAIHGGNELIALLLQIGTHHNLEILVIIDR
jgi:hypothetical protein